MQVKLNGEKTGERPDVKQVLFACPGMRPRGSVQKVPPRPAARAGTEALARNILQVMHNTCPALLSILYCLN